MANPFVPPTGAAPAPGSAASAPYDALFHGLLELTWKEISIPYMRIKTRLRQDLAIHKFADRNGARVEGTGQAPLEFTARVPLLNGIAPGPAETWKNPLYPNVLNTLLLACLDKSAGTLQHPELGPITCKVETMEWELEAQVRSGVWVDFAWIQTDEDETSTSGIGASSALSNAQSAANDLDSYTGQIPGLYQPPVSFTSLMQSIRAVTDTPTLLQKQYAGQIDNVIYQANQLEASINRSNNALTWPIVQASERAKEAAYVLKSTLLTKGKQVALYTTLADCSMALLSARIPSPLADLMILNPPLLASPLVPAGSAVRYYASAA